MLIVRLPLVFNETQDQGVRTRRKSEPQWISVSTEDGVQGGEWWGDRLKRGSRTRREFRKLPLSRIRTTENQMLPTPCRVNQKVIAMELATIRNRRAELPRNQVVRRKYERSHLHQRMPLTGPWILISYWTCSGLIAFQVGRAQRRLGGLIH